MSRDTAAGSVALTARHLRHQPLPALLLGVLLLLAILLAAVAPRALGGIGDAELQTEIAGLSPLRADLVGRAEFGALPAFSTDPTPEQPTVDDLFGRLDLSLQSLPESIAAPLGPELSGADWIVRLPGADAVVRGGSGVATVNLAIDTDAEDGIRYVDGGAPAAWTDDAADDRNPADREPIEIALSAAIAERLGAGVGDVLDYDPAPLRVAGVFEAQDPAAAHWTRFPDLLDSAGGSRAAGVPVVSVLIDPVSADGLRREIAEAELRVWYDTDASGFRYADSARLLDQLGQLGSLFRNVPSGQILEFESGLGASIEQVTGRIAILTALLALLASAPLGALLAVLLLGVRAIAAARRPALLLARARGASPWQLAMLGLLEGLLPAVPATAAGIGVAALIAPSAPEGADGGTALLPLLALGAALPLLFAVLLAGVEGGPGRRDLSSTSRGRLRLGVEVAVVAAAGVALWLTVRRGYAASSAAVGVDPLLAALPLLLALAVCVVALRLLPLPLLGLLRMLRRRRGAVGLLGAAQAVRGGGLGVAAALPLVVGVAAAVFSLTMAATLSSGLERTVREEIGADIQLSRVALAPAQLDALSAEPGVAAIAGLDQVGGVKLRVGDAELTPQLVFADLDALRAIRPELPAAAPGDGIGVYVSPQLGERLGRGILAGDTFLIGGVTAHVAGIAPGALPGTERFGMLVEQSDQRRVTGSAPEYERVLVDVEPGADAGEVGGRLGDRVAETGVVRPEVAVAATELAVAASRPSTSALLGVLGGAGVASLGLAVIALVLAVAAESRSRNRTTGVLRVLGLAPRRLGGLLVWELAPVGATALLAGTATGIALAAIVTAVIDLRVAVGGTAAVAVALPVPVLAGVVAGILVLLVAVGVLASRLARRADPASTLKIGAE